MAYVRRKYRAKRASKRRPSYRRRASRRYVRRRRVPRGVSTMANVPSIQHLRYVTPVSLLSEGGIPATYKFRANSAFDPDLTGVGHQPMRFDQMAAFYARYVVIGSKITVRYCGYVGGTVPGFYMTLYLDDDSTPPLSLFDMMESGKCKYRTLTTATDSKTVLTERFSPKKFFGVKDLRDNYQLGAVVTANPADEAFFIIKVEPVDGSSNITIPLLVTIDYIVAFSEPVDLSSS